MGIKDDFMGAKLLIKISAIVVLVAQLFNWISFCTTSWITTVVDRVGLWRHSAPRTLGSTSYDGTGSDSMAATQAFAIFGFVGLNVGCLLLVLFIFWSSCKGKSETGLAAGISLIVSAVTWLIAVSVIAADFGRIDYQPTFGFSFGFSFGLAICALILAGVAGVLTILGQLKIGSVSSK
ncbi:unnamed protein product [Lymnaea stagnalis]|uniref:Uncharacterized protein n=1 Tax=Lymnaea stagnalis TaxID=6523 RepID=A0AAV2IIZ8_LYMST